ncbi:hypothetical protein [Marinifilum fragile]|uniref:hypothetical protein n=1 Tax=Marinifilum fragile TaxID=570161 RepID=UPI002AABBC77|nr:hypothetical protein [Marinifilum fragile]
MAIYLLSKLLFVQIGALQKKKRLYLYKNGNFFTFFARICTIMTIAGLAMPNALAISSLQVFQCHICYSYCWLFYLDVNNSGQINALNQNIWLKSKK